MGCKWPEHHGGGGTDTGTGGSWVPLGAAVIAAALFAPLIGVIIHVLALVLTFVGIAAVASGGGVLWWRLAHRQPRQLAYRPQMQVQPRWGRPGLPQDQQDAIGQGGQHLHLHLGGLSPAERAEVMRQLRGGH
jgi:hypothetical protein